MLLKLTACSCRNMMDLSAPHDTMCSWSCMFRKRTAVMEDEWSSNVWTKLYSCNEALTHISTTFSENFTTKLPLCYLTTHWHFHLMTKCSQFFSSLWHVFLFRLCQLLLQFLLHVFTYFVCAQRNKFIHLKFWCSSRSSVLAHPNRHISLTLAHTQHCSHHIKHPSQCISTTDIITHS